MIKNISKKLVVLFQVFHECFSKICTTKLFSVITPAFPKRETKQILSTMFNESNSALFILKIHNCNFVHTNKKNLKMIEIWTIIIII